MESQTYGYIDYFDGRLALIGLCGNPIAWLDDLQNEPVK
jgi:hypothetical protein